MEMRRSWKLLLCVRMGLRIMWTTVTVMNESRKVFMETHLMYLFKMPCMAHMKHSAPICSSLCVFALCHCIHYYTLYIAVANTAPSTVQYSTVQYSTVQYSVVTSDLLTYNSRFMYKLLKTVFLALVMLSVL